MTDAQRKEHQDRFMNWVEKELQTGNPQHQAYIGELVEAVINRRKEMGLDPLPFDPNRGR